MHQHSFDLHHVRYARTRVVIGRWREFIRFCTHTQLVNIETKNDVSRPAGCFLGFDSWVSSAGRGQAWVVGSSTVKATFNTLCEQLLD